MIQRLAPSYCLRTLRTLPRRGNTDGYPVVCMEKLSNISMKTHHTKHATYKLGYHFVWCPKYRKRLLVGPVAALVERIIREVGEELGWEIGALNIQRDHVHLFLSAPPSVAPSMIAHRLKGVTARRVFQSFPAFRKIFRRGSFWSRSYYVGSAGDMSPATVLKYIGLEQDE